MNLQKIFCASVLAIPIFCSADPQNSPFLENLRGKTADDVIGALMASDQSNPVYKSIKRGLHSLNNAGVKVQLNIVNKLKSRADYVRDEDMLGSTEYFDDKKLVKVNMVVDKSFNDAQNKQLITHELVHAVTSPQLQRPRGSDPFASCRENIERQKQNLITEHAKEVKVLEAIASMSELTSQQKQQKSDAREYLAYQLTDLDKPPQQTINKLLYIVDGLNCL